MRTFYSCRTLKAGTQKGPGSSLRRAGTDSLSRRSKAMIKTELSQYHHPLYGLEAHNLRHVHGVEQPAHACTPAQQSDLRWFGWVWAWSHRSLSSSGDTRQSGTLSSYVQVRAEQMLSVPSSLFSSVCGHDKPHA